MTARLTKALAALLLCSAAPFASGAEPQQLFNGKDLAGWSGDTAVWSVQDGQIVGTTVGHKIDANTFLVWQGGEVGDFRLTYQAKLEGDNNSGVQYRSVLADPKTFRVIGYQADMHSKPEYTAMLYGEGTGRHIIAERGQRVVVETDASKTVVEKGAFSAEPIDISKWHEYSILAQGNHLIHSVDGKVAVEITDNHEKKYVRGILALQVHAGPPMTVCFKDIVLEKLGVQPLAK